MTKENSLIPELQCIYCELFSCIIEYQELLNLNKLSDSDNETINLMFNDISKLFELKLWNQK